MSLNYYWSTPVLTDVILNKNLLEKTSNYILSNYGDNIKVKANLLNENILEDQNLNDFQKEIIIPSFDVFYKKEFGFSVLEKKFHLKGWITGYGSCFSMPSHNHSGSQLSAVFYLIAEEIDKGGNLILHDPRFNANRGYKEEYNKWFQSKNITPKTGEYIIFPSFMYHNVEKFLGKIRLAMPVDLILY